MMEIMYSLSLNKACPCGEVEKAHPTTTTTTTTSTTTATLFTTTTSHGYLRHMVVFKDELGGCYKYDGKEKLGGDITDHCPTIDKQVLIWWEEEEGGGRRREEEEEEEEEEDDDDDNEGKGY